MAIANLAMLTGNLGKNGGCQSITWSNNVQGSCDMGSFPHELPELSMYLMFKHAAFEQNWGVIH